ncbi:secretion/conjugation apparatus DotM-related subunit [Cellvibrio sp. QJXJ]|uniref:secretion/conjugation apparatus DotM-related subunit n=1 Tax=Cellvibrio sp. QJXJ TaxID=2964606 RepID=UPI0021C3D4AE|nr:hypothetical protein [Cellvibrio sp. QJXJ]UUA75120.1 hypothetical protein NNX04_21940 [Cellvibrio sp. QJXJ]
MSNIQENRSTDTFGWIYALFFVFIAVMVLFTFLWSEYSQLVKNIILASAYHLRHIQLPFTFLMSDSYSMALYNMPNLYSNLMNKPYDDEFIIPFLTIALRSIAICIAFLAIPRAIYLIRNNDRINYTRHMNLRQIIEIMREKYPRIKPTTARWLLDEDARFGSLGSQLNPIDLIVQRGLISLCSEDDVDDKVAKLIIKNGLSNIKLAGLKSPDQYLKNRLNMTHIEYAGLKFPTGNLNKSTQDIEFVLDNIELYHGLLKLDVNGLKNYYLSTLGPRCRYVKNFIDIRKLPPAERSLWILFLACIAQKKELRITINNLLDQFADSFEEGEFNSNNHKIDLSGIDELYEKIIKETSVIIEFARISKAHGYYYTAFTELYTTAKKRFGTITSQDFRWLKITNRILFYSLNQVGLERARYESAAIRSHYLAEKKRNHGLGGKIGHPQIDSAVLNTVYSLDSEGWLARPLTYEDTEPTSKDFMKACWINPN